MKFEDKARLTGKFLYRGELFLESPLLIGTGEKEAIADEVLLKNEDGDPYIPATSIVGVMRHYMENNGHDQLIKNGAYDYFWGSSRGTDKNTKQSALYLRDLALIEGDRKKASIRVRDGVAIDNSTGIAEDKKKFEYEVLEPGVAFQFYMEITLREAYEKNDVVELADYVLQALSNKKIALGAKTTRGLGRCTLQNIECCMLDFSEPKDVRNWLNRQFIYEAWEPSSKISELKGSESGFSISALFTIKNSLLVRSYSGNPKEPDAVHICSGGQPVLPGTSLAGALRARAEKIANTFMPEGKSAELIHSLFGWVDDEEKNTKKYKSRVYVEENLVKPDHISSEEQTRIKIDRFTGGTLKAHLFDEKPLWPKNQKEMVTVNINVHDCKKYEAGLLLLVLKDLWNADLPLGGGKNIGRGVLQGISAEIDIDNDKVHEKVHLGYAETNSKDAGGWQPGPLTISGAKSENDLIKLLQDQVDAFHKYCLNSKEAQGIEK